MTSRSGAAAAREGRGHKYRGGRGAAKRRVGERELSLQVKFYKYSFAHAPTALALAGVRCTSHRWADGALRQVRAALPPARSAAGDRRFGARFLRANLAFCFSLSPAPLRESAMARRGAG